MKNIKIDYITKTITVTRAFYEAANDYGTEEQMTMQKLVTDFPEMQIAIRSCKSRRNNYKGLTYDYMRKYIRIMDCDNRLVFEDVIEHYKSLYAGVECYTYVKEWFLQNYPEYKEDFTNATPKKHIA